MKSSEFTSTVKRPVSVWARRSIGYATLAAMGFLLLSAGMIAGGWSAHVLLSELVFKVALIVLVVNAILARGWATRGKLYGVVARVLTVIMVLSFAAAVFLDMNTGRDLWFVSGAVVSLTMVSAFVAVISGSLARRQIRSTPGAWLGRWRAAFGTGIGYFIWSLFLLLNTTSWLNKNTTWLKNDRTLLYEAVAAGNVSRVETLLAKGDGRDLAQRLPAEEVRGTMITEGQTLLFSAAVYGHRPIVKLLLDCGVDADATSEDGMSALAYAIQHNDREMISLLADHGADVKRPIVRRGNSIPSFEENYSPVLFAVHLELTTRRDYSPSIDTLLKLGSDVNASGGRGLTPLIYAAFSSERELTLRLVNAGADVNAKADNGLTSLMMVSVKGSSDVADVLLEHGAQVDSGTADGLTSLMLASDRGSTELVSTLVKHGAKVNAKTKDGRTAMDFASAKGHTKVVELLRKAGARS